MSKCLQTKALEALHLSEWPNNFSDQPAALFNMFFVEVGRDQGPEHRESKMTVLCTLIIIILIS